MSLTQEKWVNEATELLMPYIGENAQEYAESLYETYVVELEDPDYSPERAVEEDMSYWGD
jgi:hypothetical protein